MRPDFIITVGELTDWLARQPGTARVLLIADEAGLAASDGTPGNAGTVQVAGDGVVVHGAARGEDDINAVTVAELASQLAAFPQDAPVRLGPGLAPAVGWCTSADGGHFLLTR